MILNKNKKVEENSDGIPKKLETTGNYIKWGLGVIIAIAGATVTVESRYAHAADIDKILQNQSDQIKLHRQTLNQQLMFQQEYYDQQIKKLELERNRSIEIESDPKVTRSQRAYTRRSLDIQEEINETKSKREQVKKQLVQ